MQTHERKHLIRSRSGVPPAELNLVVSAPSSPSTLLSDRFAEVVQAFPDLQIVIEHLAGVGAEAVPPYDEFKRVLALAKHPNLTIKLPGLRGILQPALSI